MTNNKVTYLKDYQIPDFLIDKINLDIDLYEDKTIVIATVQGSKNQNSKKHKQAICLAGSKLLLKEIKLNNNVLSDEYYKVDKDSLTINNMPNSFTLEIITQIEPHNNTELVGLYKSNSLFCTQCEAEGFRRITYYLDRPDVMAKFTTTIRADKKLYPILLSNGNLIAKQDLPGGRHLATWDDPFKKPSYLFAMVAGDLVAVEDHFLTQSGRLVTIKLYVERENLTKTTHALYAIKQAMAWDEKCYGREYDLDIYMIVAVNDFNMGAMENKGLNIFNAKYVLASPQTATDQDFKSIGAVIGHEYFHNWSGNRVTCRDWFQLSLKEGFTVFREQQFTQDISDSPVARIEQVKLLFTKQFAEDASPLAHAVRPTSYEEINNFYTLTIYEKGAEIIRMLHTLLGQALFHKATDLYFERHDGQAATVEDFIKAMTDISEINLSSFMLWYTQAGTPEVTVVEQYDEKQKQYNLTLTQNCPATPGQANKLPMQIPIALGLLDQTGKNIPLQLVAEEEIVNDTKIISLNKKQQTFTFVNINSKPILSILRDFSAPININTSHTAQELAFLVKYDSDAFNRWDAFRRLKKNIILTLIADRQGNADLELDQLLITTYKSILADMTMNFSLKAELLMLPTSEEILKYMQVAEPEIVYQVKNFLKVALAKNLTEEFYSTYINCIAKKQYTYNVIEAGKRQLKNVCLDYLLWLNTTEMCELGQKQFMQANNMTDLIGVLIAITHIDSAMREKLLADFYNTWQHEPLIVNKWLFLQATSELPNTIDKFKELLKHKIFDINNPNKVYALVGGFAMNNPIRFHASSGDGYKIFADVVLQLDQFNPQVAARMANAFADGHCYDQNRQNLIKQQLTNIINTQQISKNLFEIANKCLQGK